MSAASNAAGLRSERPGIGLVSIDAQGFWPGGRYLLHHLIRSASLLPAQERLPMRDAWWLEKDAGDTSFDEVRDLLEESAVVRPPGKFLQRLGRKLVRMARRRNDFGDLFRAAGVDVLFPTASCEKSGVPLVYLLTDFQHLRRPDLFSSRVQEWFVENFSRKVREAELVIVASRDTLDDFRRFYPNDVEKARLVLCASLPQDDWFALDPLSIAREKGLREGYFLISNQFTEHKNHLTVFEAVRMLKERGVEIEVACTGHSMDYKGRRHIDRLAKFIDDHSLSANIKLLGFLPRAEQMALFRAARAIVHPSLFEGWSSAVEDARSLGRWVIASDIAIHREKVDAAAGALVDPNDPGAWAEALLHAKRGAQQPDESQEAEAVAEARRRAMTTGRTFVAVMREAAARYKDRTAR